MTVTHKVRSLVLVGRSLGVPTREVLSRGLRWQGVSGGDHVVTDWDGRVWRVDLVTEQVSLCVGVPPKVSRV